MKHRKLFSVLLALVCAVLFLALPASAQTNAEAADQNKLDLKELPTVEYEQENLVDASGSWYSINWSVSGSTLTISGSGYMVDLNYYYNYPWYNYSGGVTKLVIGNNVNGIGSNAFSYMSNLTTISFGKNLSCIGTNAFRGCTGLKTLTIPSQVTEIYAFAFQECTGLTSISLPTTLEYIGAGMFYGCTGLKEITLNTDYVSANMFQDCTGLTTVTLGKNVGYTEYAAFEGCLRSRRQSCCGRYSDCTGI